MSINPVFCNIYLWFNLSTMSFFLVCFCLSFYFASCQFHTCYICCSIWILLLFVGKRNKLTWLVFLCDVPPIFSMICFWLFSFFLFPFLPFPSFLHLPTLSFSKLLATSQIKSLGFQPEFCFLESLSFLLFHLCFLEAVILNHCPLCSFSYFFSHVFSLCWKFIFRVLFFWVTVTVFRQFSRLWFWCLWISIVFLFVSFLFSCLLLLWESLFVVLWTEHQNWKPFFDSCSLFQTKEIKFFWSCFEWRNSSWKISLHLWSLFSYFYTLNLFVSFSISCFCTFGSKLCPSLFHFALYILFIALNDHSVVCSSCWISWYIYLLVLLLFWDVFNNSLFYEMHALSIYYVHDTSTVFLILLL